MPETPNPSSSRARRAFAERLRAFRIRRLFSQQDLAAETGIAAATISAYERGLREPTLSTLVRLAEVLQVTPDYLLDIHPGTGEPDPLLHELFEELRLARSEQVEMVRDFWSYLQRKDSAPS